MDTGKQFCAAAEAGNLAQMQTLLAADAELIHSRSDGATALHFAALRGRLDVIDWLLSKGADIDALDEEFQSPPIGWANETGKMRAVDLLDERGATYSLRLAAAIGNLTQVQQKIAQTPDLVNCLDGYGTPLHAAVLWGQYEVARYLLQCGADISGETQDGLTALELAMEQARHPKQITPLISEAREEEIRRECLRISELLRHHKTECAAMAATR
jgi:ankyrin repeat protein